MEDDEIVIGVKESNKKGSKKKSQNKKNGKARIKKEEKEKSLNVLKIIALVCIFSVLIIVLLSSSLFNISTILVEGNDKLSDEKVISLSSIELHTNMFTLNKSQIKSKLKESSYIEDAKISRKFPSTIVININERIPTYMLQFADSYVYINNQGYMLEISNEKIEVPILTGFTTDLSNIKPGNRINTDDLKKMGMVIRIYQSLANNDISEMLSKIDVSNEKNYTLYFDSEQKKVYLGNASDLSTRIVCLKGILETMEGKPGEIFLNVDLNTEKPYFRENVNIQ